MARRGPKPEPAAVKEAKGNPGRRAIGSDSTAEASAKTVVVAAPTWLKADGLKVWQRLAPRLASLKLLSQTDAETFGRYCRNFARWMKMQKRLDDIGEIYEIETASGKVRRADPAFLIGDRLERQLVTAEAVFGLNPAERQRIFAARAAAGSGAGDADLFGNRTPAPRAKGKTRKQAPAPAGSSSPIGFLQ
ncbi:phage terminase small subunit P27 family [Mesorhizobium sp. YC-39]|uniref:phage terminase small subunit P27 family n=1 Tax=unclassified Mesorhizobium TaxID=325217 RepID=UPI0021E732DF|nr:MULTISPECIES: phage terminase small subunit P27 family [unclassified Mesorhizobium]MCV3209615.1 phage terminase small subunit P27 family [Mesorhizobium sp. YC-2]MCV3230145.1 phage terminase small subunit P27 family [Mesorhizobium sp. YC-39]